MIPRPPTSTLFPYTTLFRSLMRSNGVSAPILMLTERSTIEDKKRSEEHTSELQSLTNLVCRLLLEKKKKNKHQIYRQEKTNVIKTTHETRTLGEYYTTLYTL